MDIWLPPSPPLLVHVVIEWPLMYIHSGIGKISLKWVVQMLSLSTIWTSKCMVKIEKFSNLCGGKGHILKSSGTIASLDLYLCWCYNCGHIRANSIHFCLRKANLIGKLSFFKLKPVPIPDNLNFLCQTWWICKYLIFP